MISFHDIAKGSNCMMKFTSVSTGIRIEFPAFITEFSDSISSNFSSETVYGRMDPIQTYQGTQRRISGAFDVVSPCLEIAKQNMFRYSQLVQVMYPVYSEPLFGNMGKGRTLKAPPIMRLEFMNLIRNNALFSDETGLMGTIDGVSFSPNREAGFFTQNNELLSKHFNISFTFQPLHEGELGFERDRFITENFPYARSEPISPSSNQIPSTNSSVQQARANEITGNED